MAETLNEITTRVGSLLSSTNRVEAPFIRVKMGDYSFGVYEGKMDGMTHDGLYKTTTEKFPNYVQSLDVKKINGSVNTYNLTLKYPIGHDDDPNFFEKLFSSISSDRKISIDYGDFNLLNYIYKDEDAIITNVGSQFDIKNSVITYTVSAVSASKLAISSCHHFPAFSGKPSDKIKEILKRNSEYHLLEVFTGMTESNIDELVAGNDQGGVTVPACVNISALDYISKLVSYMVPVGSSKTSVKSDSVFVITSYEDTTGKYGGPYLKVQQIERDKSVLDSLCTYTIDIGYPTANLVNNFRISNQDNWSIYYDYNMANKASNYITRVDDKGNEVKEFSPLLTGTKFEIEPNDKTWWTNVTEFPIQAEMDIKGLLKPAILCTYVRLNIWFYGRKHAASGYYIITKHEDHISGDGYYTSLGLQRVSGDDGSGY